MGHDCIAIRVLIPCRDAKRIDEIVEAGHFTTKSDFVRTAIREQIKAGGQA
ncbi:ribbon-helix-helix domain-containing protein [Methanolobus sp. WCC5]|uniref:ribbon-helix-helix domain-containing protein n=1 Tax=Methanolobus sp. WCC5 TaxID=3125785 RepID=UPI003243D85B